MNSKKRTLIALIIGIIGFISLFFEFSYHAAYSSLPIFSYIGKKIEYYFVYSPSFLFVILGFYLGGAIFFIFPLSIFGFFLSVINLKEKTEIKVKIFSMFLNLINFFLSIIIAILLFGLARGI